MPRIGCSSLATSEGVGESLELPEWQQERHSKQIKRKVMFDQLDGGAVLQSTRVILVAPKFSANVGAVARLCANFECNDLWVVAPRCDPLDDEAKCLAVGSPALANLTVTDSFAEALADTTGSIGFTRRDGAVRHVHPNLSRLMEAQPAYLSPQAGCTALVFGREDRGLEMEELAACSELCALPTGRVQPSLNLSQAAGIALAQCFERRLEEVGSLQSDLVEPHPSHAPTEAEWPAATSSEVDFLVRRWGRVAGAVGLPSVEYDGGKSHYRRRRASGHLRAIFSRARVNTQEARSLIGLTSKILKKLNVPLKEDDENTHT
ncbi:hypothetical protein CYMTET_56609 [Cymbomonas tetramitiformis]|uniref:tRNA/rRNA methyltransferase SpoU type domain-containing protein n=1 Tax=Cymbomonas tetramitiformis TaxID=36881 RepID=A0AAE0BAY9_9CHLO|nr:hypothetical protein CYMTET_56609 [Cymbomonas tetramitiformis]